MSKHLKIHKGNFMDIEVKPFLENFILYMRKERGNISKDLVEELDWYLTVLQDFLEERRLSNPNKSTLGTNESWKSDKFKLKYKISKEFLEKQELNQYLTLLGELLLQLLTATEMTDGHREFWISSLFNKCCRIPREVSYKWINCSMIDIVSLETQNKVK